MTTDIPTSIDQPDDPEFTPVPRQRARHDGWTAGRQWAFIQALADTGSVTDAARAVLMDPSSAYRLRRHPDAGDFRRAWDAALDQRWSNLAGMAIDRLINGETEVIEHPDGRSTIHRKPCSDRLLIAALQLQERRRERAEDRAEARAEVRAEARAEAAVQAGTSAAPAPAPQPPSTPARAAQDDAAAAVLHDLTAGFTDKPGWEGPLYFTTDTVPEVPRAARPAAILRGNLLASTAGAAGPSPCPPAGAARPAFARGEARPALARGEARRGHNQPADPGLCGL